MANEKNLIWMDLEMTGLDVESCWILEIATLVTDADLHILAEGPSPVLHQPKEILDRMDPWCAQQHGKSGLTREALSSCVTAAQAEEQTLEFLKKHCVEKKSPLCGNSVRQDRLFLKKYMPRLYDFFHYRDLDVSTVKELVQRWYPKALHFPPKESPHRALPDARESIAELQFYRQRVFQSIPPRP